MDSLLWECDFNNVFGGSEWVRPSLSGRKQPEPNGGVQGLVSAYSRVPLFPTILRYPLSQQEGLTRRKDQNQRTKGGHHTLYHFYWYFDVDFRCQPCLGLFEALFTKLMQTIQYISGKSFFRWSRISKKNSKIFGGSRIYTGFNNYKIITNHLIDFLYWFRKLKKNPKFGWVPKMRYF